MGTQRISGRGEDMVNRYRTPLTTGLLKATSTSPKAKRTGKGEVAAHTTTAGRVFVRRGFSLHRVYSKTCIGPKGTRTG